MKNKIKILFEKIRSRIRRILYPGLNEPKLNSVNLSVIADIVNSIKTRSLSMVELGVYSYDYKKNYNPTIGKKILEVDAPISFINVNCSTDRKRTMKTVKVKHVFYTICDDDCVWEYSLTTYCKSFTFNDDDDEVLIHVCNMLAYGILNISNIFNKSKYEIKVPDIRTIDIIGEKQYDGYIETYGDSEIFKEVDINETDIDNSDDIEIIEKKDSMIVDVYRKRHNRF